MFCRPFMGIHRTIQKCIWSGLEFATNYKGKFLSISSTQEASKDREFVTPHDIQSLNKGSNRPVAGPHSITVLAGYSADLTTLSASSCLCAQTGETFCRKVASAGNPSTGIRGAQSGPRVRLSESNPAGREGPAVGVSHSCERGCKQGSRDAEGVEGN